MRLKSFFADTIEEAITQARRDMGPDAMLVDSKPTHAESRHLGAYEVVICAAETGRAGADQQPESASLTRPPDSSSMHKLSEDVSQLRRQMERMAVALARSGGSIAGAASDADHAHLLNRLTDAELDTDLIYELLGKTGSALSAAQVRSELGRRIRISPDLGCTDASPRVVAVVGPPGAGKTSALVKLAVQYGIIARRPSHILSMDMHRVAASDELRSYAAILGIGCQVLETTAALAQALEEHRNKNLIFIDTPGLCRNELESYRDLAHFLASYPGIDTHLVLSASMRALDLKRVAGQYAVFQPRKLLFTRLDETETFGPLVSQSVRMDASISFLSRGQRIPEDLEPATTSILLDLILGQETAPEPKFDRAAA